MTIKVWHSSTLQQEHFFLQNFFTMMLLLLIMMTTILPDSKSSFLLFQFTRAWDARAYLIWHGAPFFSLTSRSRYIVLTFNRLPFLWFSDSWDWYFVLCVFQQRKIYMIEKKDKMQTFFGRNQRIFCLG